MIWYVHIYIYWVCLQNENVDFCPKHWLRWKSIVLGPASFDTIIGFLMLANSNLHYPTSPPRMIVWLSSWFVGLGHEECLIEIRRNNLVGYSHIFQKKTLHLPHEPNPLVLSQLVYNALLGSSPCLQGEPQSPALVQRGPQRIPWALQKDAMPVELSHETRQGTSRWISENDPSEPHDKW